MNRTDAKAEQEGWIKRPGGADENKEDKTMLKMIEKIEHALELYYASFSR